MHIVEVQDKKAQNEFLMFPVRLYKDEKNWIRPLDQDIESVFDPKKNKKFRNGEAIRWLLLDDQGRTIGRVAAFIDYKLAKTFEQPTGGMGFFECVNNQEAAFKLLDQCKQWLTEKGMEAMDGPVNFGERDRWWGLLVDGFTEPNYCTPYNFGYYQTFFENYGFKEYFKQYTYYRRVKEGGLTEKVQEKADRIFKNPAYQFKHVDKKQLDKYAEDFCTIYNKAWVKHKGVQGLSILQAKAIFRKMKPVMDEKIVWFAYYENEPIAFFVCLPELNQIFKHVNGKLDLIGKLTFLYHKYRKTCKKMFGVVFGVVPEHQKKGLEGAMAMAATATAWQDSSPYLDFEMNWIGDFNPKMMRIAEEVGGKINKTHITYRLLFDPTKEFKRAPIIN
jgi:hypothetical protein